MTGFIRYVALIIIAFLVSDLIVAIFLALQARNTNMYFNFLLNELILERAWLAFLFANPLLGGLGGLIFFAIVEGYLKFHRF